MPKGPFHIVAEPVSQSRMAHSVIPGTKVAYGDRAWWLFLFCLNINHGYNKMLSAVLPSQSFELPL